MSTVTLNHPLRRQVLGRIEVARARAKIRAAARQWQNAVEHGDPRDITDMLLTDAIGWRNQADLLRQQYS